MLYRFYTNIRTVAFDNRARMSGMYPISSEILDKHVHHVARISGIEYRSDLRISRRSPTISSARERERERGRRRANEGDSRLRGGASDPALHEYSISRAGVISQAATLYRNFLVARHRHR